VTSPETRIGDWPRRRVPAPKNRIDSLAGEGRGLYVELQSTHLKAFSDLSISGTIGHSMQAIPPNRLARAIVGASLTFLAISLFAPGSVKAASCDHPSDRPSIGLDAFKIDGSLTTSDQFPRPKPCNGPSCSNKSAPPSTSSPQPPPRAELWGLGVEPLPADPLDSSARAPEATFERPIRLSTSIFHPPRKSR
jgi:hypothetical protein